VVKLFPCFSFVLIKASGGGVGGVDVRIVQLALILAVVWTVALASIARSVGLHSTPGTWAGVFGLPGVVIANWAQTFLLHRFNIYVGYAIMFLINWMFYCSVILGILSVKRSLWD
jgi:hypothetical protein